MKKRTRNLLIFIISVVLALGMCSTLSGCGKEENKNVEPEENGVLDMAAFKSANGLDKIFEEHNSVSYLYDIHTADSITHELDYFTVSGNSIMAVMTDEEYKSAKDQFTTAFFIAASGELYTYVPETKATQMLIDTTEAGSMNMSGYFGEDESEYITGIKYADDETATIYTDLSQSADAQHYLTLAGLSENQYIVGKYIIDPKTNLILSSSVTAYAEAPDIESDDVSDNTNMAAQDNNTNDSSQSETVEDNGVLLYSCTVNYDEDSPIMTQVMNILGFEADIVASGADNSNDNKNDSEEEIKPTERTDYTFVVGAGKDQRTINASIPLGMKFVVITDTGYQLYEDKNGTSAADAIYISTGAVNDGTPKTFYILAQ